MLYTLWDDRDGTIIQSGSTLNPDRFVTEEWHKIKYDVQIDDALYAIDVETGEPVLKADELPKEEKKILAQIDQEAENIRGLFITNTPSQPAVYMAKESEALLVMSDPNVSETQTPQLNLEAVRTGESRFDCAVVILTQANTWRQLSALIEFKRLSAKDAVRAATTLEDKRAAALVDYSDVLAYVS